MLTRLQGTRPGQGFPRLGRVPQCGRTKLGIEAYNDRFALIVPDKRELGQTVPPIWCEFPIRATHFVSYRSNHRPEGRNRFDESRKALPDHIREELGGGERGIP